MTSPAVVGAGLAVLGLGVAGVAYVVDKRGPVSEGGRERVVASYVPEHAESVHH